MRIAQRTVSRNYIANLNRTMVKRADALRASEDGLRFKELSEDVAAGARAMSTQEMRYAAVQQQNTAEELVKELDSAWGVLGSMDQTLQDVLEEMKSAAGVRTEEKLEAIQKKVHNLKEQYLQELNSTYGGKYHFGGTNNKSAPFTTNENDELMFNGVRVADIYRGQMVGTVGTAADDALYANDARYTTDGTNYYLNDGKFYYAADKQPPEFGTDLTDYSATVTPTGAFDLSLSVGDQPVEYWDGTMWQSVDTINAGAPTITGDNIADWMNGKNFKIGDEVYTVTKSGTGEAQFTWQGTVKNNGNPATDMVSDDAAAKAAGYPAGALKVTLTPQTAGDTVTVDADIDGELAREKVPNTKVPYSDPIYLDTGLGLTVSGGGTEAAVVDPRSAFQVNVIGLEAVGFTGFVQGVTLDNGAYTEQTIFNNIYDAISAVEKMLSPGYDEKHLDALQMQLTTMNDTMRMARTDIDTRATTLENMIVRLKTEIDDMEKLEDSLMTAQPALEATKLKDLEYTWQAVLALGSKILPPSLLDYLR